MAGKTGMRPHSLCQRKYGPMLCTTGFQTQDPLTDYSTRLEPIATRSSVYLLAVPPDCHVTLTPTHPRMQLAPRVFHLAVLLAYGAASRSDEHRVDGGSRSASHRRTPSRTGPSISQRTKRLYTLALLLLAVSSPCSGGTASTPPRHSTRCSIASISMTRTRTTMRLRAPARWMMGSRRAAERDPGGRRRWRSCWRSRSY